MLQQTFKIIKRGSSPKSSASVFKNKCKDSISLWSTATLSKIDHMATYSKRISKFTECKQSCLLLARSFVYKLLPLFTLTLANFDINLLPFYNFEGYAGNNESKCSNSNGLAFLPFCTFDLWRLTFTTVFPRGFVMNDLLRLSSMNVNIM